MEVYHVTQLQQYSACGRKYQLMQATDKEQTSPAMLRGLFVHALLEEYGGGTNEPYDKDAIPDVRGAVLGKLDAPFTGDIGAVWDEAMRLWQNWINRVPPHVSLVKEFEWSMRIGHYQFEGTIDALWEMPDETIVLVDYKTSQQLPSQFYLDESLQFGVYAYVGRHLFGNIDRIAWGHIRDFTPYAKRGYRTDFNSTDSLSQWAAEQNFDTTPAGKAIMLPGEVRGPGIHYTNRTDEQLDLVPDETNRIIKGIKFKIFPRVMSDMFCKSCGFQDMCRTKKKESITKAQQNLINEMGETDE